MVCLAMYKGKGLIGNALIRWWTKSQYSHCELVVDGVCYSSSLMDRGVRSKSIALKPDHWDLLTLPNHFGPLILDYYSKTKGNSYSWKDLFLSQILNWNHDENGASFCSEWCAKALGIPNPTLYSPRTLFDLVSWMQDNK
jgi:hypothetical protein